MNLSEEVVFGNTLRIDSVPCVIREILFAPPCPQEVAKLLEVALTHHNTSHYELSIQTYIQAQDLWNELEEVPINSTIYFRCAIGSVYESCGQDELALAEYMEAKRFADTLGDHHPDKALTYNCIGCVYQHMSQVDIAMEYFSKALELREKYLLDSVDYGVSLNNVGVCFHCKGKMAEAIALYEKAFKILCEHLGLNHPRTMLISRNISIAKMKCLSEYVLLFSISHTHSFKFEKPKFEPIVVPSNVKKPKVGKKKKGKKKGKGKKKKK